MHSFNSRGWKNAGIQNLMSNTYKYANYKGSTILIQLALVSLKLGPRLCFFIIGKKILAKFFGQGTVLNLTN